MARRIIKRALTFLGAWIAVAIVFALRYTCRIRWRNDPRPRLKEAGQNYLFCVMHAHQVMATIDAEPNCGAMVSKNMDGDMIAKALALRGVKVMRGSNANARGDRGGRSALAQLQEHVEQGFPVCLAADGPRGPRGRVHKGIAHLAQQTGAVVIVVVPQASRKWIFTRTWDRMQLPKPFSLIEGFCSEPLASQPGERLEAFRRRIEQTLIELELQLDPSEAAYNYSADQPSAVSVPKAA